MAQQKYNDFSENWKSEEDIRRGYPSHYTISYGKPYKSKTGSTDLLDWTVTDKDRQVAVHTMMILKNKTNGKPYAVVSFKPKPTPLSPELKALLNEIAKNHGH